MNEKEQKIKELRAIEANKKNYMGLSGKFGLIVKTLGQPIIEQHEGGSWYESSYLDEVDNFENDGDIVDELPKMDVEERNEPVGDEWRNERIDGTIYSPVSIGWYFEGLNIGMHIEILYKENDKLLRVSFKGHVVYKETMGELEAFVPGVEWESLIDKLYISAKEKHAVLKRDNKQKDEQKNVRLKKNWLKKINEIWGV
jgi:hypothetical protein